MGRPRKPRKMEILEGCPGRRPLPSNEVEPAVEVYVPNAPSHLSETARAEWNVMSERLHRLGLLTEIDYAALAAYCQAYGRWVDAELAVKKSGLVLRTQSGNVIQSPFVGIANRSMELLHRFLVEFGMTPSSRTKAAVAGSGEKTKFAGLLSKKRFSLQ